MAPTNLSIKEDLILKGVSLRKKSALLQSATELCDYREDYLKWKKEASDVIQNNLSIPLEQRLIFATYDDVESDFWQNGGAGGSLDSSRVKTVVDLIKSEIDQCINFLNKIELEDERLIIKDISGNFYYQGRLLKVNQGTLPYIFLDIMINEAPDGWLSYEDIIEKISNRERSVKDINEIVVKNAKSTLFADSGLPDQLADGRKIIRSHNQGYKLDNRAKI